ncbi:MAG: yiaD [Ignavibacteria bacterium]|nr:yiaD [Ignavibacteria bacterium]
MRLARIKIRVFLLILSILTNIANAQFLSFYSLETNNYPIIKANFYAIGSSGNLIINFNQSDINLNEDGIPKSTFNFHCDSKTKPDTISTVVVIDISGSMQDANLIAAKTAAQTYINFMPNNGSETAIVSFNDISYLNCDFTTDKNKLSAAVQGLKAVGGTNYDAGLLNKPTGALSIAERGKYKRIIVFITDGVTQGDEDNIVMKANLLNASIFCVTLNLKAPDILKRIAQRSNGLYFENVTNYDDANKILATILKTAQGFEPCSIEWITEGCRKSRKINLSIKNTNLLPSELSYSIDDNMLPYLQITPSNSLNYLKIPPGQSSSKTITLTAKNDSIRITDFYFPGGEIQLKYPDGSPTFTLKKDSSINVIIDFNPSDSIFGFITIKIQTNSCRNNEIFIMKGFPNKKSGIGSLKLNFPNGNEKLIAATDTAITWEGILPIDSVKIQYSLDNQKTWLEAAQCATGFSYLWKVPILASDFCKVRIRQSNTSSYSKLKLLSGHNGGVLDIAWEPNGTRLASCSDDNTIKIWDTYSGIFTKTLDSNFGIVRSIDWSPDGKYIIAGTGNTINIWDVATGVLLTTLNGHKNEVMASVFSHDGKYLASGDNKGILIIWDFTNKIPVYYDSINPKSTIFSIAWSSDDSSVAFGGLGKILRIIKLTGISKDYNIGIDIYSLSWKSKEEKIAISGLLDSIIVLDLANDSIKKIKANSNYVQSVAWSPDGAILAAGTSYESIILFNGTSGQNIYTFYGHLDNVMKVSWNDDGNKLRIASASLDMNIEIWSPDDIPIDEPIIQQDISDDYWSILIPKIKSHDIDMGSVREGEKKDSVITDFLNNLGSVTCRIDSITLKGADEKDFSIISDPPPFSISAGIKKHVEFRFSPTIPGDKNAIITIFTPTDTITTKIKGTAKKKDIELTEQLMDFGQVVIGNSSTITKAVLINKSNTPTFIDSTVSKGPDTSQFQIISGGGGFMVSPNTSREVTVKFKPDEKKRTSGSILFYSGTNSPIILPLFGEGIEYGISFASLLAFPSIICTSSFTDTTISINNIGTNFINITSADIQQLGGNDFFLQKPFSPVTIPPNDSENFRIRFNPLIPGVKSAKFVFISNINNGDDIISTIDLVGRMEKLNFEFSSDTLDFGESDATSNLTATFSIINNGTLPVKWELKSISPEFRIDSIIPPGAIEKGGKSVIYSSFSSVNAGKYYYTLTMTDSCKNKDSIVLKAFVIPKQSFLDCAPVLAFPFRLCNFIKTDTVFIISNTGTKLLEIYSSTISGAAQSDFNLTARDTIRIQPGKQDSLLISFNPQSTGSKNTLLNIYTNASNATVGLIQIPVSGRYEKVQFSAIPDSLFFGEVEEDSTATTTFTLTNNSSIPIEWRSSTNLQNYLIKSIEPLTAQPGESSICTMTFKGGKADLDYFESITFIDTCKNSKQIKLNTNVYPSFSVLIYPGNICGNTGDTVDLPVYIQYSGSSTFTGISGFSSILKLPAEFLNPVGATPQGTIIQGFLNIPLIQPFQPIRDSLLQSFKFIIIKNIPDTCKIILDSIESIGRKIQINDTSSVFRTPCKGSGIIIGQTAQMKLYQSFPNPTTGKATIDFELFREINIELAVYNILGDKVGLLAAGAMKQGRYSVEYDTKILSIGYYFYVLSSDVGKITGKLEVMK